jgi:PHD/YefM family antitoxin component YafN of YafNO toxin-antitoxin module
MPGKLVVREPLFIEDDGEQVAVLLPIDTYRKLQAAAKHAASNLDQPQANALDDSLSILARESRAFEALKPELLKTHRNQYVAIVGGEVVETGDNEFDVIERVYQRLGRVVMFVDKVTDEPRPVHYMSSPKVIAE